jgi:hypothetical protein
MHMGGREVKYVLSMHYGQNDWTIGGDFGTEVFNICCPRFKAVTHERQKWDVRSENIQLKGLLVQFGSVASTAPAHETLHRLFNPLLPFLSPISDISSGDGAHVVCGDIPPSSTVTDPLRCDVSCRDDAVERLMVYARGDNRALSPEFIDGPIPRSWHLCDGIHHFFRGTSLSVASVVRDNNLNSASFCVDKPERKPGRFKSRKPLFLIWGIATSEI